MMSLLYARILPTSLYFTVKSILVILQYNYTYVKMAHSRLAFEKFVHEIGLNLSCVLPCVIWTWNNGGWIWMSCLQNKCIISCFHESSEYCSYLYSKPTSIQNLHHFIHVEIISISISISILRQPTIPIQFIQASRHKPSQAKTY